MRAFTRSALSLLLLLPALAFAATDIAVPEFQARQAQGEVVVVDVRKPDEFAAGHVPGAVNIPHDQAAARVDEFRALQRKGEIVLYCHSGRRAGLAAAALEGAGMTGLRHLVGDFQGWQAAGLPVQQDAAPAAPQPAAPARHD